MQLFLIVITALLTSLSESKNSPSTQLRGSSSRDDNHEHRDNTQHGRSLQTKCGGGVKTTLFKGNITMQSLLRPLQCSAAALNNIGIVLDLVFDDVVKGNQALSAVTLNTTVCTTPIITAPTTGNYFNRQLATQLTAKYTYRAGGGCRLCNPDDGDRRARQLQQQQSLPSSGSVTHSSHRELLLSSLLSGTTSTVLGTTSTVLGTTSNVLGLTNNLLQVTLNSNSTFLDYVPLLELQLKLFLTKEITLRFVTKLGHCLFGAVLDFDVKLMQAASFKDSQC